MNYILLCIIIIVIILGVVFLRSRKQENLEMPNAPIDYATHKVNDIIFTPTSRGKIFLNENVGGEDKISDYSFLRTKTGFKVKSLNGKIPEHRFIPERMSDDDIGGLCIRRDDKYNIMIFNNSKRNIYIYSITNGGLRMFKTYDDFFIETKDKFDVLGATQYYGTSNEDQVMIFGSNNMYYVISATTQHLKAKGNIYETWPFIPKTCLIGGVTELETSPYGDRDRPIMLVDNRGVMYMIFSSNLKKIIEMEPLRGLTERDNRKIGY